MNKTQQPREEGQSVVLVALTLVAVIALAGLVVDGGRVYGARRQSQNASDAAAFAGARTLTTRTGNGPADDAKILATINTFAQANGVANTADVTAYYMLGATQGAQIGGNIVPAGATGVRVVTRISLQPFLMGVLSSTGLVSTATTATAQTGPLTRTDKIMPVTMYYKTDPDNDGDYRTGTANQELLNYGTTYRLFGEKEGPGNFQWLDFTDLHASNCKSPNTPELANELNPYTPQFINPLNVGDSVCGAPGTKVGNAVRDSIDLWLNEFDDGNRLWIIPLYDSLSGSGQNFEYHVARFAVFQLESYDFQGNPKSIQGKFLRYTTLGHTGSTGQPCNNINTRNDQTMGDVCAVMLSE